MSTPATRAARLRCLIPAEAGSVECRSSDPCLIALADALGDADVVLCDSLGEDPHDLPTKTVLAFSGGAVPESWRESLAARAKPVWFIQEAPQFETDLFAVGAGTRIQRLADVAIVDARGRKLPVGLFGELAFRHDNSGELCRTGAWGRHLPNGEIALADYNTGTARVAGRVVDTQELSQRLRAVPGVRELAVLGRRDLLGQNSLLIYWARHPSAGPTAVEAALQNIAAVPSGCSIIELPQLCFTRSGTLDWQALALLPVIDDVEYRRIRAKANAAGRPGSQVSRELDVPELPRVAPAEAAQINAASRGSAPARVPASPCETRLAVLSGPSPPPEAGVPQMLPHLLERAAATHADSTLLCVQSLRTSMLSYADLNTQSKAVAGWLQERGLVAGDRIILKISDIEALLIWFWAAQNAGLCVTILSSSADTQRDLNALRRTATRLSARALVSDHGTDVAIPDLLVVPATPLPQGKFHPVATTPDADAVILMTSGSTAEPKLIPQTHAALIAEVRACGAPLGLSADDITLNWMPIDHVGALVMFHLRDVHLGCRQIQVSREVILAQPLRWLDLVHEHRVSATWSPHFGYALLANQLEHVEAGRWSLDCMRLLINGGEAVIAEGAARLVQRLSRYGLPAGAMRPAWGMSETCSVAALSLNGDIAADSGSGAVSVGHPLSGVEMRIVGESGNTALYGEIGRLEVRGATVTRGYLGEPTATRRQQSDWFRTGDLGTITDKGVTIVGRDKDLVIVNGQNYSCLQIERELESLDCVEGAHTCAVGHRKKDSETEQVVVFVVPRTDPALAVSEVRARLRAALQLDSIVIPVAADQIPRTQIGKARRSELQRQLTDGVFDAAIAASNASSGENQGLPPWFFVPGWSPRERQPAAHRRLQRWVVLSSSPSAADLACHHLMERDFKATTLAAEQIESSEALADADALLLILDWPATPQFDVVTLTVLRRCATLSKPPQLFCLSTDAMGERARPDAATAALTGSMLGLWRAYHDEHPQSRVRWIDLDSQLNWDQRLSELLSELESADDSLVVRVRNRMRSIPRLKAETFAGAETQSALRRRGVYLITGALGDLGYPLCLHLMEKWDIHVISLTHGRPDDPRAHEREVRAEALSRAGRFDLLTADISTPDALELAFIAEFGPEFRLDGAFHLAGTYRMEPFAQTDMRAYQAMLAVKRDGAIELSRLLRRFGVARPLLAIYGSVNSELAGNGAASYTAASTAQQLLASSIAQETSIQCYYLGWSQWRDMGVARANPLAALGTRRGLRDINVRQGLQSLERALTSAPGTLLVGLDGTHEQIVALRDRPAFGWRLKVTVSPSDLDAQALLEGGVDRFGHAYATAVELADDDASTPASMHYRAVETDVSRLWQEILDQKQIPPTSNFFELGGNSLRLLQLKARLEQHFGRAIEVATLLQFPTVRQLALHFASADATSNASPAAARSERGERRRRLRNRQAS